MPRMYAIGAKIDGKPGPDPRLFDLVVLWQKVTKPRAKSVKTARLHVHRFVEFAGDLAPPEVTRIHVTTFRDDLEKTCTPVNVNTHLATLHRLYVVAMSEGVADLIPSPKSRLTRRPGSLPTLAVKTLSHRNKPGSISAA